MKEEENWCLWEMNIKLEFFPLYLVFFWRFKGEDIGVRDNCVFTNFLITSKMT
jgi:hypothetical protein